MPLVPAGQEIVVVKCDYPPCKKVATHIKMIKLGDSPNFCDQCYSEYSRICTSLQLDACEQVELLRFVLDDEYNLRISE